MSLSVCIWVETCLGDWKLSVGLDLRKASMTRRKRLCLSPDGLREKCLEWILHTVQCILFDIEILCVKQSTIKIILKCSMLHYHYVT